MYIFFEQTAWCSNGQKWTLYLTEQLWLEFCLSRKANESCQERHEAIDQEGNEAGFEPGIWKFLFVGHFIMYMIYTHCKYLNLSSKRMSVGLSPFLLVSIAYKG